MSTFREGQRVKALMDIVSPACGDHPDLLMARKGATLVIQDFAGDFYFPWIVSDETESTPWFCVRSEEIEEVRKV